MQSLKKSRAEGALALKPSSNRSAKLQPKNGRPEGATPATMTNSEVAAYRVRNRHTETGNAERFVERHGHKYRFHSENATWMRWTGTRWEEDKTDRALSDLVQEVRKLELVDPAFVLASEKKAALEAALSIASRLPLGTSTSMRVSESQLNRRRHLLPVANGVVNLRNGLLEDGCPSDLMVYGSEVIFQHDADASDWQRFVDDITCGDADLAAWLQRWCGYCATGEVAEQEMAFFIGEGANGKGVLMGMLEKVLGSVVITTPITTLMLKRGDGDAATPAVARMAGRRLVLASEGAQDARLDEGLIKHLTGTETVSARFLHRNLMEFEPTAKLMVATNHTPVIIGTDEGIWRRVNLVPMRAVFNSSGAPGTKPLDPMLKTKLEQQLPGILAWVVRGAVDYYGRVAQGLPGLGSCQAIRKATGSYRSEMDRVGNFLEDTYIVERLHDGTGNPMYRIKNPEVYADYVRWCGENGVDPLTQNGLSRELSKRSLPVVQSSGRWRVGLRRPVVADYSPGGRLGPRE